MKNNKIFFFIFISSFFSCLFLHHPHLHNPFSHLSILILLLSLFLEFKKFYKIY
ncbi:unnamed protein product [Meloidogyne enterolobii]|uniref:Uncharacterized protein n=1 Tax=Meloidogyne enterolobii TaxID=390850 RepID=A0ACB0Y4N4_MELEN